MAPSLAQATGRRKTSVARVRLLEGTGSYVINGRSLDEFFPQAYRLRVQEPFEVVDLAGRYDVHVNVSGGGLTGQSDAIRLGIARALVELDPELRQTIKKAGMLRRDDRKVERKKYGLRKARRAPQFTKR